MIRKHPLELLHPRSLLHLSDRLQILISGRLWIKVLIAMILGLLIGIVLGPSVGLVSQQIAATVGEWLALPGRAFLAAVQMVIIPLVFASLIRGLAASEDLDHLKRMGGWSAAYFVATSMLAIVIGLVVAVLVKPGNYVNAQHAGLELLLNVDTSVGQTSATSPESSSITFPDAIVELIPRNPLSSMVNHEMLQVVLFALVFGISLLALKPRQSKPLLDLMGSLQAVCLAIVRTVMRLAPLAVFGLIAQLTLRVGISVLIGMAIYVGSIMAGLLILSGFYLGLVAFVGKQNPREFLRHAREAQLLAFSTSSSAAVMPISLRVSDAMGVRPSVAQFTIPLGATINMDGTAVYQGVATCFLAQIFGVDLSVASLAVVVVMSVVASIGSPATPGAGIVILSMTLRSAGIPTSGIGLILGVDRIVDMCRTAINVTGDLVAAVVIDRLAGGKLSAAAQRVRDDAQEARRATEGDDVLVEAHENDTANSTRT